MTAPIRITIEADAELAEALGRGIGLALAPYVEELREAVQRLRTDVQAAAWSAYGRATGAREEDANETGACPPAAPQRAEKDPSQAAPVPSPPVPPSPAVEPAAPPPARVMAPAAPPARPARRKPVLSEAARERSRENAAKARVAMAAKRAAIAGKDGAPSVARMQLAEDAMAVAAPVPMTRDEAVAWARQHATHALALEGAAFLAAVNAAREGMPPIRLVGGPDAVRFAALPPASVG